MHSIFARKALLVDGWAEHVRLQVADGRIVSLKAQATPNDGDTLAGIVIPGLTNAHSHAFQRALAGRTEQRSPKGKDNFWSWRSSMYRLAGRIDPDSLAAIARQAYTEMLTAGYTGVAEFHYLHKEASANRLTDAMLRALATAAADSGIRLTYVPVLYERAGFDRPQPNAEQRQFATTLDEFEGHYCDAGILAAGRFTVGIGVHSLRAVSTDSLTRVAALAQADGAPMHLHIAEQPREVDDCLATLGNRPVRWLAEHFELNERWCLVHATHMDEEETEVLAVSGAVVCLCPSTEANLGDGFFPLQRYLECGGRIAIGSDSQVSINPFEELRWLDYGQRLQSQGRNVIAAPQQHSGRKLFELVLSGGALAGGQDLGAIETDAEADLIVLDEDSPTLLGHNSETLLDALVFSGFTLPIDRVMVRGEWRVVNGRHLDAERTRSDYARVIHKLYSREDALI